MRAILLYLHLLMALPAVASSRPLDASRQCVVVLAENWNSTTGVLRAFERTRPDGQWTARGAEMRVVFGKNGLGWGRGLVETSSAGGPRKVEGDNRAPAGIFRLGPAFGYAPAERAGWIKLRYVPVTKDTEGIDDPRSRHYNRLVDRAKVARIDWRTSEQMLRSDRLYKWGIVVAHNPAAIPRAGSCIFVHIWKNASAPTAGCTAMKERDLVNLLHWLEAGARPILVQAPRETYRTLAQDLRLPPLSR